MRFRRTLTALLSVTLLGLPALVLSAGPASAKETWTTTLSWVAEPGTRAYGADFTLQGRVTTVDPTSMETYVVDGVTVHLLRMKPGETGFTAVADATTDGKGLASFTVKPWVNGTRYQMVYDGGAYPANPALSFTGSSSTEKTLRVGRNLHDRFVDSGRRIYLRGNVNPGWGHKLVYLQKKACRSCAWKTVAQDRTSSTGAWNFQLGAPRHGRWFWRAYVNKSADFVKSWSNKTYFSCIC